MLEINGEKNYKRLLAMRQIVKIVFLLILTHTTYAQHTFSIVAVDTLTGEIGSAGATCLNTFDCGGCGGAVIISEVVPGKGAINAQASVCIPNVNASLGKQRIVLGQDAETVLDFLLENDGCNAGDVENRQYGIVTLDYQFKVKTAGYTGAENLSVAGNRTGDIYSIQGNILIDAYVLDSMESRFLASEGLPLGDRLMAALQGANIPGADSRCLTDGISSKSSYLRVAKADDSAGNPFLDLVVPSTLAQTDPIDSLQTLYDAFVTTSDVLEKDFAEDIILTSLGSSLVRIDNFTFTSEMKIVFHSFDGKTIPHLWRRDDLVWVNAESRILVYTIYDEDSILKTGKIYLH